METVLITGGSGLIGRTLAQKLAELGKYEVVSLSSRVVAQKSARGGLRFEAADLLDAREAETLLERVNPDILCHLAWANGGANYRNSDDNLKWLEASVRLLRGFQGKRFIFAGSSSQYGLPNGKGGTERTLYGASKRMFEQVGAEYCREKGIRFASARIFTVYGPGDVKEDAAIPKAIQALLKGEGFCCRAPRNRWDFIYVEDAAGALARLVDSPVEGALDVATGRPMEMREAFRTIARIAGCPQGVEFDEENTTARSLLADVTRMEDELGYVCRTTFEQGIENTVKWWRERLNG